MSCFSSGKVLFFVRESLLKVGVKRDIAELCASGMVLTSLRGVDTHGIGLLSHYVAGIKGGRINPNPNFKFERTSASTGTFDADHGLGYAVGIVAMRHAISLAKDSGSGFVSVRNSSHCGALAYYGLEACKEDMIGLAFTHATSRMKSPGSSREFFGTNPICFAAPMASEEPYCFDSAPTPLPFHKIMHHRQASLPLPRGSAADQYGNETTDPHRVSQLLPIGDYKGFGWAMTVDVLTGLLSGMPVGRNISKMYDDPLSEKRYLGQFFGAIRIDVFESPEVFKKRLQKLAEDIRGEPKLNEDSENMVPGDPEKKTMKRRLEEGIPISDHDLQKFNSLAESIEILPIGIVE